MRLKKHYHGTAQCVGHNFSRGASCPDFKDRPSSFDLSFWTRLVELVEQTTGVSFDANMLFDVQVKRIHEYKRQLMKALHMVHLYNEIKTDPDAHFTPRVIMVGGKGIVFQILKTTKGIL